MSFDYNFKNYDLRLLLYMLLLSAVGIITLSSASSNDSSGVIRQAVGVGISLLVCAALSLVDYHRYEHLAPAVYGVCVFLLLLVLIAGVSTNGATRWLKLGPVKIQPSEFVKIGLIIFMSWFLNRYHDSLNEPATVGKMALLCGIPIGMVYLQPNLSTTIVIAVMLASVIYAAGISRKWLLRVVMVGLPSLAALLYAALQGWIPFLKRYQVQRILAKFFNQNNQYADLNRQQNNSIMAIGSGQLTGKGLFNNTLGSVKNGNFLSEEQTDFIFAVIGEEMGFAGSVIVITLYLLLVFECFWIAARARDLTGRVIAVGVGSLLAFQSFANIAVATGVFPNTGLPLPFISSGLSSMMSIFIGMGIVLNVGLQRQSINE